eukprot:GFUD01014018.1.p1 GENE.GFUD01014018.1~~GFUD01014018.1.p1  ORF type:complete len:589 (+),score=257.29 GFUD01014018.1:375-2141(+)
MNELGIRKLPRDDDGPDPDKDTTDEDSDFEEGYRKKSKPIMLKIKKEKKRDRAEGDEMSDESDWEPEAEVMPPEREQTRSGRQRKRPSFFQEFESQENNLDSILAEFEQTQAKEFGKPREPKPPPKPPSERRPRKRKVVEPPKETEEQVEVETLRSGRKRKVRRVLNAFMDEDDEDDKLRRGASSDDDDFEPPPDEEVDKIEENDDLIEEDEELDEDLEDEEDDDDEDNPRPRKRRDMALPPKKRGRPKKILTDAEIEEATRAAMGAKPVIEITRVPRAGEGAAEEEGVAATAATSVIMGPGGGAGGAMAVISGAMGGIGSVISNGVITAGVAPDQLVGVEDQGQDGALGQLADVVAEQSVLVPVTAKKSAPAPLGEDSEAAKVQPTWVNETLASDDEHMEQEKSGQASADIPVEGAFNPLSEAGDREVEENPLTVETGMNNPLGEEMGGGELPHPSEQEQQPMNEEDALLATATEQPPFVNECQEEEAVNVMEGGEMLEGESDNPLAGIDGQESEQADAQGGDRDPFSSEQPTQEEASNPFNGEQDEQPVEQAAMSEEDLLTGPAHNLDDSQYKADYVDPNLDDIFK